MSGRWRHIVCDGTGTGWECGRVRHDPVCGHGERDLRKGSGHVPRPSPRPLDHRHPRRKSALSVRTTKMDEPRVRQKSIDVLSNPCSPLRGVRYTMSTPLVREGR